MSRPGKPGRKTLREQLLATQRSLDTLAALTGKARIEIDIPPAPAPRAPRKPSGEPTEAQILKAILQLLGRHPKVARAWRVNSGTFAEQNRDGTTRYIRANSQRGMSDIMGILRDGRTLAIEVKSATGRMRPGQQEFLDLITAAGGVAGVCRSVDDAVQLLERA